MTTLGLRPDTVELDTADKIKNSFPRPPNFIPRPFRQNKRYRLRYAPLIADSRVLFVIHKLNYNAEFI